ncbi:MAG: DUF2752 domain-containing protein [Paludibacteraceae bacterium]|nr:DUF2752 domain-containing protein [Paludibacteraceae bacterium]
MQFEQYLLPCAYKQFFGISCPMCGFQRSLLYLLDGKIWQSFLMFPPLIPLFIAILITVLHYFSCKRRRFVYIKHIWLFILILLLFNFIYQNIR